MFSGILIKKPTRLRVGLYIANLLFIHHPGSIVLNRTTRSV